MTHLVMKFGIRTVLSLALDLLMNSCHNQLLKDIVRNQDMAKVSVIGLGLRAPTRMVHPMFETLCPHDIAFGLGEMGA